MIFREYMLRAQRIHRTYISPTTISILYINVLPTYIGNMYLGTTKMKYTEDNSILL